MTVKVKNVSVQNLVVPLDGSKQLYFIPLQWLCYLYNAQFSKIRKTILKKENSIWNTASFGEGRAQLSSNL